MNKEQAITKMKQGKKLTHNWFSVEEWITDVGGKILSEDGYYFEYSLFWSDRTDDSWDKDWEIFEEST